MNTFTVICECVARGVEEGRMKAFNTRYFKRSPGTVHSLVYLSVYLAIKYFVLYVHETDLL